MTARWVLLVVAAHSPGLPVAAQGVYYEGGLSVASGSYIFAERTTSWSLATGFAAGSRRLTLRVSLPVYLQNSTLISLSGPGGGVPTGGASSGAVADTGAARKSRGGGGQQGSMTPRITSSEVAVPTTAVTGYTGAVGDPTAQLSWGAVEADRTRLTASVLVKAPVADTATFGTGEWDMASGLAVTQQVGSRGLFGLDLTYWRLGDLPTLNLRNPLHGTVSATYLGENGWAGGLSVSLGTSALDGYDGPGWVGGHVSRLSQGRWWSLNAGVGFTETAPDVTVGAGWRVRILGG